MHRAGQTTSWAGTVGKYDDVHSSSSACSLSRRSGHLVRVTHPFHPLVGRAFEFVEHQLNWGEDRVCLRDGNGKLFHLPGAAAGLGPDPAPRDGSAVQARLAGHSPPLNLCGRGSPQSACWCAAKNACRSVTQPVAGRPQRCWRSLRRRGRSSCWAASTRGGGRGCCASAGSAAAGGPARHGWDGHSCP
jgi:hypothetical protein